MKLLILFVALGTTVWGEQLVSTDYHNDIGIPAAIRIKAREEAADFDGARITGGSAAALGAHPHLGGLVITLTTGQTSVCGCSLLTNTRAVTAAHCWRTNNSQGRQLVVVLGSTRLFSGGVRVTSSSVNMHANYNPFNLNNDIAIINLSWVAYTNVIQPIALTNQVNNNFVGTWAWAAGFGATGDNQPITNNQFLSEVSLQVITNAVCASTYGTGFVVNTVICTSGNNQRSTCGGDSGGPLWIWSGNQRQLIGITCFGHTSGCQRNFPVGFVRVTSFISWIQARL